MVAEVHNTYGERHCYLLRTDEPDRADVAKEFYVSPFFPVDGAYRMRLPEPGERLRSDRPAGRGRQPGRSPRPCAAPGARPTTRALLGAAAAPPLVHRRGLRRASAATASALFLRGLPVQPRPRHRPQEGMQ